MVDVLEFYSSNNALYLFDVVGINKNLLTDVNLVKVLTIFYFINVNLNYVCFIRKVYSMFIVYIMIYQEESLMYVIAGIIPNFGAVWSNIVSSR